MIGLIFVVMFMIIGKIYKLKIKTLKFLIKIHAPAPISEDNAFKIVS